MVNQEKKDWQAIEQEAHENIQDQLGVQILCQIQLVPKTTDKVRAIKDTQNNPEGVNFFIKYFPLALVSVVKVHDVPDFLQSGDQRDYIDKHEYKKQIKYVANDFIPALCQFDSLL